MSTETAFDELYRCLCDASERLSELRTTVVEDSPEPLEHHVVTRVADQVDELMGWLAEAVDSALEGHQTADGRKSRDALERCQVRATAATRGFFRGLAAFENIVEFLQFAYERGPAWRAWAEGAVRNLQACEAPLLDIERAVFACALQLTMSNHQEVA
jgi:hypothetical protein